jgi:hypothetical protein
MGDLVEHTRRSSRASDNPNRATLKAKITPEIVEQITNAVRAGNYIDVAAAYVGVHRDTLYTWMKKGRVATSGPYYEFVAKLDQALAAAEVRDVALIGKAAEREWTAAAWRLERKHPDRYGRRTRIDGNIRVTTPPWIDMSKLDDDEFAVLRRLVLKARPEDGDPNVPALEAGDVVDGELLAELED